MAETLLTRHSESIDFCHPSLLQGHNVFKSCTNIVVVLPLYTDFDKHTDWIVPITHSCYTNLAA